MAKTEAIDDVKDAYARTQAKLIEVCESKRLFIEWWRENEVQ